MQHIIKILRKIQHIVKKLEEMYIIGGRYSCFQFLGDRFCYSVLLVENKQCVYFHRKLSR